jgi:HPt (histidine-containing phosphotransfer) domain-containing protein
VPSSDTKQKLAKLQQETILAVDEAIKKLQGKESLYTELIHDFWLNYQVLAQEMVQYYKLGQTEVLYRNAHSLKSTAQYIGAYELATCANALENEIHHQGSHVELKLNEVTRRLDFIISQLNGIYHLPVLTKTDKKFNIKKAERIIEKLKPCLISANIQAEHITKELMVIGHKTPYHQHIADIQKLVNNFDFDEALAALLALEKKINNAK